MIERAMTGPDPLQLLETLRGARLDGLQFGAEEDTWYFLFTAGVLRVMCAWRFARADGRVLGPGDLEYLAPPGGVEELPAELIPLLGGRALHDVRVNSSGDLGLRFEGGVEFTVLCDKFRYENWILDGSEGHYLVAVPGGQLVAGSR